MTIQEIYDSHPLRVVENEILVLERRIEKSMWCDDSGKAAIKSLLDVRKAIMNEMFVMDDYYKQLLYEFNEAIKEQMIEVRKRTIALYESVCKANLPGIINVVGKCYMGYNYPKLHPIQDNRAHQMWDILNGCIDTYIPLYKDGLGQFEINTYDASTPEIDSINKMFYLGEEPFNCNDGLDREKTKDMMLVYQVHDLYDHMEFSIFDLLWVRDFEIELHVEVDEIKDSNTNK